MESRLEYLENLIGDNADKHQKLIEESQKKLDELHAKTKGLQGALDGCADAKQHASIEERVEYLESFVGESADKHAEFLKHAREITSKHSALTGKHDDHRTTMEE